MALANIARWLTQQDLKVVIVDWDLEAPGIESFFAHDSEKELLRSRFGLLELLTAYKDIFGNLPAVWGSDLSDSANSSTNEKPESGPSLSDTRRLEAFVNLLDEALPPLSHAFVSINPPSHDPSSEGKLFLLPAGSRGSDRFNRYAEAVQSFDWTDFYTNFEGEAYFEWMRRQLESPDVADIVLIDSRTGVAEMSGVCTRQLADVVVCLCAPNDQNLDGIEMMAKSFLRPDLLEARNGRPLQLIMTPARIDISDGRPVDIFEERFAARLAPFTPRLFAQLGIGFSKLRIPYIKEYAYSERVAIGDPEGVKTLQEAYTSLAAHIAVLAPPDSPVRDKCRDTLQRVFGLPTVFVGCLTPEEAQAAGKLKQRLDQAGIIAILEQDGAEASVQSAISAPSAVRALSAVVLAVSEIALSSDRARLIWQTARENGVCLYFVTAGGVAIVELPRWARRSRLLDEGRDWEELLRLLRTPCAAKRVPMMAPPFPTSSPWF